MQISAQKDSFSLDSNIKSREFAQSKLFPLLKEAGFLVHFENNNPSISPWFFSETKERNVENEKYMTLVGPSFEGEVFYELLVQNDRKKLRKAIYHIQLACIEAQKQKINLPETGPMGIIISNNAVLFLPEQLTQKALNALSQTKKNESYGRFVNRNLKAEKSIEFSIAVYLYYFFSGSLPFPSLDEEKRQEAMQYAIYIPLQLYNPSIPIAFSQAIETILKTRELENKALPLLNEDFFSNNSNNSTIDLQIKENLANERKTWLEKKQKTTNRLIFLKKQKTSLFIILGAFALIFFLALTIAHEQKIGPNSIGLNEIETIEAYYTAVNTLDLFLSSKLLTKKAQSPYTSMMANYHVLKTTRQAFENINPFVHPYIKISERYVDSLGLYGITNLKIGSIILNPFSTKNAITTKTPLSDIANGEKVHYSVQFYLIKSDNEDNLYVECCIDNLELLFYKNRWLINSIEAQEQAQAEITSYQAFLDALQKVDNLVLSEKIKILKKDYPWIPSLEEIQIIESEGKKQ